MQTHDKQSIITHEALYVFVIGPQRMQWQIEGTAAAAEKENHWNAQPLGSLVNFPAYYLFSEGGGQFMA